MPKPALAESGASAKKFLAAKRSEISRYVKPLQKERLKQAIDTMLDYEELAKRSLDSEWNKRSAAERKQFVDLLQKIIEKSYENSIRSTLSYEISYGTVAKQGSDTLVETTARSTKGPKRSRKKVLIKYTLHKVKGQWMVCDITTSEVNPGTDEKPPSMVENYRLQFKRIINKYKWKGLIKRMRKKA